MNSTAIFGGTFNPFHIGHLKMLEALEKDESIDKILVMPDKIPPHKLCDFLAEDNDRINMARLMSDKFKKTELCLVEFERSGKSYSFDTVTELKKRYKDEKFSFVCGGDMLISFEKWYKYESLMKMVEFIVFKRKGEDDALFLKMIKRLSDKGMKIRLMDEEIPFVSSTFIRNNINQSKNLLPKEIFEYIMDRGIYYGRKGI